jgi:hypothetical protein
VISESLRPDAYASVCVSACVSVWVEITFLESNLDYYHCLTIGHIESVGLLLPFVVSLPRAAVQKAPFRRCRTKLRPTSLSLRVCILYVRYTRHTFGRMYVCAVEMRWRREKMRFLFRLVSLHSKKFNRKRSEEVNHLALLRTYVRMYVCVYLRYVRMPNVQNSIMYPGGEIRN